MYTYDQAPSGFTENVVMINLTKNLWSLTWWSVVGCLQVQGQALENGGWETTCWGCRLRLLLPVFAPIFKCGWCGAITIYKPPARPRSQCSPTLEIARDRVLVVAVLLFIVSIVYGGVWTVFPILFPKVSLGFLLNSTITALLTINTLLNYCFAALIRAGSPPQVEWAKYDMVGKGSLEGYRFCVHCQQPKPPSAHHCRICRSCILDMDHHCPFVCVTCTYLFCNLFHSFSKLTED